MIGIEDFNLIFYILNIQHNTKGHHEKQSNLNNALLLLLGLWPKNNDFSVWSTFLVHFTILAS